MYYLFIVVMVGSSLRVASASYSMLPERQWPIRSHGEEHQTIWKLSVAIAFLCCAVVLVPERPEQLASICERHNPEIACQVW